MEKTTKKTTEKGKAIVAETAKTMVQGITKKGQYFLECYEARQSGGKAFAAASQNLRELKSNETRAFFGKYAVPCTGFAGAELYKAPEFEEAMFRECLTEMGWTKKRLPTAQLAYCKKHGIEFSTFEKACLDMERASRKAGQRAEVVYLDFPDEIVSGVLSFVSDELPLGKVMLGLERALKIKLADM